MASYKNHIIAFGIGIVLALGGIFYLNGFSFANSGPEVTADMPAIQVYRSPTCGCCMDWVEHLRESGFTVTVEDSDEMGEVKKRLGVPNGLTSCHTATVGDYVVEGHVPAREIAKILTDKPENVAGLSVPGMPIGSPGMERGDRQDAYNVIAFNKEGRGTIFSSYHQD